jgi:diacylglycerol kinase family enzyme
MLPACAPVPVSLGRMTTNDDVRLFICMAGIGFDARTVRIVDPTLKRRIGKFSYWVYAFRQLGARLPLFRVRVNGREYLSSFALLSRVRNYGGDLAIARRANLLEDRFAVVLFSGESSVVYVKYLFGVVFNRLDHMHGVRVLEANNVEVEPLDGDALDLQLDGEHAGFGAARYDIVEGQVRLLVPAPYLHVMTPATVRLQYESS